jgi:c-di-GMP-binding flagellar brake protein YcgR
MNPQTESERRKHVRITIRAYGYNYQCRLQSKGHLLKAHLIDIALGGARLNLLSPPEEAKPQVGDVVQFSLEDQLPELAISDIQSSVRWTHQNEVGLQFLDDLRLSLVDLQNAMAP